MYPYNRALNRSLRRTKKNKQTDSETSSNMSGSDIAVEMESEIIWDPSEYKLTYLLDNFKLPQIVRVIEGFMLSEDDSLASGTVLTIHGQQTFEQICGQEAHGLGRDINIHLNCPYKVKISVPNKDHVYRTIKDLCNASPLPKCVIVQKKISVSGQNIPAGRCLIVNTITRNHADEAFGLLVSNADNELNSFVLPLKVEGNFRPCPSPRDQARSYFIRELSERPMPIWVEFVQSAEKNAPYGPHLGVIKLFKISTSHVVYATSVIDGEKYAISFSRDLPVTIEVARGMLDNTATYVRRLKVAKEQVDMDVLSHLTESSPYRTEEYRSSAYDDVKALREALKMKELVNMSSYSTDSKSAASSEMSYGEDSRSLQDGYITTYRSSDVPSINNGSMGSRNSQGRETVSCSSAENLSLSSLDSREIPAKTDETTAPAYNTNDVVLNQTETTQDDFDSEDEGYEKVADWMDRPAFRSIKQKGTQHDGDYSYPEWRIGAALRPLNVAPEVAPRLPCSAKERNLSSSSEGQDLSGGHKKSKPPSPDVSMAKDNYEPDSPMLRFFESDEIEERIPETLGSDLPTDGFFSVLDKSDGISVKSDEMSVISDYQSVRSEQDSDSISVKFTEEDEAIYGNLHEKLLSISINTEASTMKADKTDLIKPEVPKRPPRVPPTPLPRQRKMSGRKSSNSGSFESETITSKQNSVSDFVEENNNAIASSEAQPGSLEVFEPVFEEPSQVQVEYENTPFRDSGKTNASDNAGDNHDDNRVARNATVVNSDLKAAEEVAKMSEIHQEREEDTISNRDIIDETEEGVCIILDKLNLSDFKEVFKENQINGQLLAEIDENEFVTDIGLTLFQARKLRLYIQGWRVSENEASGDNDPGSWSVKDVATMMESINLKSLAVFCAENKVDGKLLEELLDERLLQCLRESYNVKLSSFEEKKLKRFVKGGWRPDSSIKR